MTNLGWLVLLTGCVVSWSDGGARMSLMAGNWLACFGTILFTVEMLSETIQQQYYKPILFWVILVPTSASMVSRPTIAHFVRCRILMTEY